MKKLIATVALAAFALSASSASAFYFPYFQQSSDIEVKNASSASVTNVVTTSANTGANSSFGGSAKNKVFGKGTNGSNEATGGDSDVATGDAWAASMVGNDVNTTKTKVSADCGCKGDITVKNKNSASVTNLVDTYANTGSNVSAGGDAKNKVSGTQYSWWWGNNGNNGSNEATGGDSDVVTGDAGAEATVVNTVNHTVTRIVR